MKFPNQLKYTKDHEWAKFDGQTVTIGVTDHAQQSLGDVVFVELPALNRTLKKGEAFGVVESIKAVSDLYAPVDGKVVEINSALTQDPSIVNRDPYESAWMIKLEVTSSSEDLLNSDEYSKYVESVK